MVKFFLFKNPVSQYYSIKSHISSLKEKNKKMMNQITSSNQSADFWWVITGHMQFMHTK